VNSFATMAVAVKALHSVTTIISFTGSPCFIRYLNRRNSDTPTAWENLQVSKAEMGQVLNRATFITRLPYENLTQSSRCCYPGAKSGT